MPSVKQYLELVKKSHNRSTKPMARLKAALAARQAAAMESTFNGSVRRGLSRGHIKPED